MRHQFYRMIALAALALAACSPQIEYHEPPPVSVHVAPQGKTTVLAPDSDTSQEAPSHDPSH
jgi:hypothetical protein